MNRINQLLKANKFHDLHKQSATFILPNAWDPISAKIFQDSGFQAIGTTSAGIATSLGYEDGEKLPVDKMIDAIHKIARSVNVPVSADIEAGYGETVDEIVDIVKEVINAGAIGINIEDGTGKSDSPIADISFQKEVIRGIKELSVIAGIPLFINARTDYYWLEVGDTTERLQQTIKRANEYEEAGAHCIFIPGVSNLDIIKTLRKEIDCSINLLAHINTPSVQTLSELKIERLSSGSGPFRAAVTLLKKLSEEMMNEKTYKCMTDDVLSYKEIAQFMQQTNK